MSEPMDRLVERLLATGVATKETIIGCTPEEVAEVRADHDVERLPGHYEQFLLAMGKRAGELLRGTDFFYPHILELDADGRELLADNDALHLLAEGSLIIGMHQGYELYWLEAGEPSGPLVWYQEPDQTEHRRWPTLLDFLMSQVEDQRGTRP